MVGSMSKNEAGENAHIDGTHENNAGIQNGTSAEDFLPNEPGDGWEENDAPEMEAPSMGVPSSKTDRPSWTIISNQNNYVQYYIRGKNSVEMDLYGSVLTSNEALNDSVSPEDQAMLELFGQWIFSVTSLDYATHFSLFHEKIVEDRFLSEIAAHGYTYDQAISQIRLRTYELFPVQRLTLNIVMTENCLLSGAELESHRKRLANDVPDAARITAVRSVAFTGTVALNVLSVLDLTEAGLICYEYDGIWYLDHSLMDDDMSVDLLLSDRSSNMGYFKTQTETFTVVGIQNRYLVTEEGTLFFCDIAEVYARNDKGNWERVSYIDIPTGESVTVTYYNFEAEGITFLGGDEGMQYSLCSAKTIRIGN
jgi:hypothetical protein